MIITCYKKLPKFVSKFLTLSSQSCNNYSLTTLTLSWRRSLSYRNQSIDLLRKEVIFAGSDFRKFYKFWTFSRKLIPAKFLAKTNSRKLILAKYASQISKLLNLWQRRYEGTNLYACLFWLKIYQNLNNHWKHFFKMLIRENVLPRNILNIPKTEFSSSL